MLDIKFIRENKDLIAAAAKKKHIEFVVDDLLAIDDKRRVLLANVEKLRSEQNAVSAKITSATPQDRETMIEEMKKVKADLEKEENSLKEVMKSWQALMIAVPNIPDISVPEGLSDADNKQVRNWGDIPKFDFEPKSHIQIMETLGLVDFEKGAEVSGFRGYFLKKDAAKLMFALWQYALDFFTAKGLDPLIAPAIVRPHAFLGTGYLPQGAEDLYKTQDGDYLSGTAEVPTMSLFSDVALDKKDLPKKILAFSPCYRREAGSHGKDTKGLMRLHEFYKFEQVILCEASHEESMKLHEWITANAEEFLQSLGIPYQVVVNCGGDLGLGQVKKYDIECWVPSEKKYRETHSASYFHDFQTRRLNIRYKDTDGKLKYAHSLNNTASATPRFLISVIENYQQADGSINIPPALIKYFGKDKISL